MSFAKRIRLLPGIKSSSGSSKPVMAVWIPALAGVFWGAALSNENMPIDVYDATKSPYCHKLENIQHVVLYIFAEPNVYLTRIEFQEQNDDKLM